MLGADKQTSNTVTEPIANQRVKYRRIFTCLGKAILMESSSFIFTVTWKFRKSFRSEVFGSQSQESKVQSFDAM